MNLRNDYRQAGVISRAIVAKRAGILSVLGLASGALVQNGVIPDGLANSVTHWATVALGGLGVVVGVLWAQRGVTPADPAKRPADIYGNELVSALTVGPHSGKDVVPADTSALDAANAIRPA